MPSLPNQLNTSGVAGSQWDTNYLLRNDDGTVMSIAGKTFEFVVRPTITDTAEPALVSVSSAAATAQGYITVNVAAGSILVVLSPTATALLGQGARPYTLWMDPGLPDATALVVGMFLTTQIAAA